MATTAKPMSSRIANVRGATDVRRTSVIVVKRSTEAVGSTAWISRRTVAARADGSAAARTTRCFEKAPLCQKDR